MYKIQDDPIKFVQNFLVAVDEMNENPSRTAIFRTFNSLLDPVVASDFNALKTEDPDDAIEKFICQKTQWSHLATNIVDAQNSMQVSHLKRPWIGYSPKRESDLLES